MSCHYPGSLKAVSPIDGHVSKLLCAAHAADWKRQFPGSHLVTPRLVNGGARPCEADWQLPQEVP